MAGMSEKHPNTEAFPKGVGQPAIRALAIAGFSDFRQLSGKSEASLLKLHGVGPKSIRIIRQALIDAGLEPMEP
jgi:hypothetical protein